MFQIKLLKHAVKRAEILIANGSFTFNEGSAALHASGVQIIKLAFYLLTMQMPRRLQKKIKEVQNET